MIIQALVKYYESLLKQQKTVARGWCRAKVAFALELSEDGSLKGIIPLKQSEERGKKTVWLPINMTVPQMVARSSGIAANFLCDNSKYLLGIDSEGSQGRVADCFAAASEKHLAILVETDSSLSNGVKNFFESWDPSLAWENPALTEVWEEITDGSNLVFCMEGDYAHEDEAIIRAWEHFLTQKSDGLEGICLATGRREEIARIHTVIRGVRDAQSSGAALVSFNAPAFESYGKEQSYNAPVGEYAAFAYTTALNYLLSQKEYVFFLGDTTVVCWAENGEEIYQKAFGWFAEPKADQQKFVHHVLKNISSGKPVDIDGQVIDENQPFYVLGLAPNAARLSVRFFYRNSFGNIVKNVNAHYERMKIVKPAWEQREYMGIWSMVQETVHPNARDKKAVPNMAANVLRAILSGSRYPANLYINTLMRIRAEQGKGKITWGRAGIIKAYLILNGQLAKGDDYVEINEETKDKAYVLGKLFAVLEAVQEAANPGINATIRDRYFNAACATPAMVFPILMRLKNSHIRKLENPGARIYYEQQITKLACLLESFPSRLTLDEQGRFILGYYHGVQKRFTKKEEA